MIETHHTPGPWRVQATGHSFVVEAHTHTEAISVDANGNPCRWSEYNEANARLIAAAPELLEALQEAVDCGMVPTSSAKDGGAVAYSRQVRCADLIRAAIAKALGGQA